MSTKSRLPKILASDEVGFFQPTSHDNNVLERVVAEKAGVILAERLRVDLPLVDSLPNEFSSALEVFACYDASIQELREAETSAKSLLSEVCSTQVVSEQGFDGWDDHLDETINSEVSRLMANANSSEKNAWMEPEVQAELADLPIPVIHERLSSKLNSCASQFATRFYEALLKLAKNEAVGLVEYASPTSLRIHYFQRRILTESEDGFKTTSRPLGPTHGKFEQTLHETRTSRSELRLQKHTHDITAVGRFRLRDVDDSGLVLPKRVKPLLSAIPEWLVDFVALVDGQMINEAVEEKSLGTSASTSTRVVETKVVYEPAVILNGVFVLSGWNADEHYDEIGRRNHREDQLSSMTAAHHAPQVIERSQFSLLVVAMAACLLLITGAVLGFGPITVVGCATWLLGAVPGYRWFMAERARNTLDMNWVYGLAAAYSMVACIVSLCVMLAF